MFSTTGLCAKVAISLLEMVITNFVIHYCQLSDHSKGTGGESIYGDKFEDEAFPVKHEKPFLLSMVCSCITAGKSDSYHRPLG